jgi:hypothetical protein
MVSEAVTGEANPEDATTVLAAGRRSPGRDRLGTAPA